jgi:NADPH-dependent curcumin reductase CurA
VTAKTPPKEEEIMSERETSVVTMKSYANGTAITEANFGIETRTLPELSGGEVLLQTLDLSPEPYMRGRMTGLDTFYVPQIPLNDAVESFGIARVLASKNPAYETGQIVYGMIDWAERSVWRARHDDLTAVVGGDGSGLKPVSGHAKPHARALDVVGIPGLTAYFAVTEFAKAQPHETVLISSAAGSVGSIIGQMIRLGGSRVIGIAGSDEKCRVLTEKLGFDAALNYKSKTLEAELQELMPKGPDLYIDHVGGKLSQLVMSQMRWPARILEVGQISTYDDESGGWVVDMRPVHNHCLQWTGYMPLLFVDYFPGALAQLGHWHDTGKIIALETIYNGIENAPKAFAGMLRGENTGKMLIHLAD